MGRAWSCLAALGLAGGLAAAQGRPLVADLGVCSSLATDTYPADTQNWFDAGRNAQVVFYAQLLFPVDPLPDETLPEGPAQPWHPPMAVSAPTSLSNSAADDHYAEAEWLDPAGNSVALFGMTLTARAKSDWVSIGGRAYIPHTFAMAIGTRDRRASAGQTKLPDQEGQYTVRLKVDGASVGLAFFRMLSTAPQQGSAAGAPGAAAVRAAPTPVAVPTLPPLRLP
ncbi:MAG TPA: hypothetical protein VK786_06115 [bacterium]|nr:hypothetical protein [bacterium]